MSKMWKPNQFRYLDRGWDDKFMQQQEKKLDADHDGWRPKEDGHPPINDEYAIGLELLDQDVNLIRGKRE